MEPNIINLNRISACVSLQSVSAALKFLGDVQNLYQPHNLHDLDATLADGLDQLRDHFTASFYPSVPDFSLEVVCQNSFSLPLMDENEALSCSLNCRNDVLEFGCSASVNGHVVTSKLFQTNLACLDETDSLPQLLCWISYSEKVFQEIPIRITHKFSPDFQSTKSASQPAQTSERNGTK
jgi:hypothetical protein